MRPYRDLHAGGNAVSIPRPVAGIVEYFVVNEWRKYQPAELEIAFRPQPVPVPHREPLPLNEPEVTAIAIGDYDLPRQRIPRRSLGNCPVFRTGIAVRKTGGVAIARPKRKEPAPEDIVSLAQFAPEDRSKRKVQKVSEAPSRFMCFVIQAEGIHERHSCPGSPIDVETDLRPELLSGGLGRGSNTRSRE
jgi:hypothetical protein